MNEHVSNPVPRSSFWQYTEWSNHSVRVGEEARSKCVWYIHGTTSCVCVPLCYLPVWSCWQASVCAERLPQPTEEIKHFRGHNKYRETDMASSSSLTSALPLFSRKARRSLISSMACSTLSCTTLP